MSKTLFDITNLVAIILICIGIGHRYGWDFAAMAGGALMMAINFRVARLMTKGQ